MIWRAPYTLTRTLPGIGARVGVKPSVMYLLPLPTLGEGLGEGTKEEQGRREPN
jgi:hypothetical protein